MTDNANRNVNKSVNKNQKINKILMVCWGNICRSPIAEAVLRAKAKQHNITLEIDSAGTINYHQGHRPDPRAMQAGEKRGYNFKGITSRIVNAEDFDQFDLILTADNKNIADLKAICPASLQYKIKLLLSFSDAKTDQIPDPYYGGDDGFELVLDLIEDASERLLEQIK
jgi:protein-tyrosine phosphatase